MPTFPISLSASPFHFLFFLLPILLPVSSISHETLTTANPNFDPQINVLGDATISDDGSRIQLTNPHPSSSGILFYNNPSRFLSSRAIKMPSFSTEFDFSFTGNGRGISLIMGPSNFASKFLDFGSIDFSDEKGSIGIEFSTSIDSKLGDYNTTRTSITVNKGPSTLLVTKIGEKLKSWIDYDSSSNRLEIRLGKLDDERRPNDPIIAYSIDLSKMWQDKGVFVGLGSRNGINTSEICNVYSWRFRLRKVPNWMHSLPADPNGYKGEDVDENLKVHRRKVCPLTILAGMIFATVCGALMAFVMLYLWAIFVNKDTVFPIEGDIQIQPLDFKYEKIHIIVEQDEEKALKN
ncbi:putative L-type lectin-domain containing receptor kinase V.1 [Euphorbia lathyris]|uniref:putative L-type lectin-domain containing receptor kinase V.1 n=1 Tax=Euphorbia lathyris TaxID=212925 RepID=UPI00331334E7